MNDRKRAYTVLTVNTLAFTVCFAAWMLNGVLLTFLTSRQIFDWTPVEIGFLMGIPVLTGSIFRLPAGILTDKFGGKPIFGGLLLLSAVPMYLLSYADSLVTYALCSFGFGLTGVSFAIGIAFTSVWYPRRNQGTALGIFGAGNAGAALTTALAPSLLDYLTNDGAQLDHWRRLPMIYSGALLIMGVIFLLVTENKKPASSTRDFKQMLEPLKRVRVWRFGLYYFLVFGCFVAFSQWLMPYFVNVYRLDLVMAGIFAAMFSFPSGVIRAFGGWLSDKIGARIVMYWVLGASVVISFMLVIPKMEVISAGPGVMSKTQGVVTEVTPTLIRVGQHDYTIIEKNPQFEKLDRGTFVFPTKQTWQKALVKKGQRVEPRQLLAEGVTRIYFQANVWIFAALVILLGSIWGIGKAAVYKHIPDYFPEEVGVVGGMVGVLGGLGGFICPIIFGYLLQSTGLWTSCWMFMCLVSVVCLVWMHLVIGGMMAKREPQLMRRIDEVEPPPASRS